MIKQIQFTGGDSFGVTVFDKDTLTDHDYGVVMPDGLVVTCGFGMHAQAYAAAITLYIAKHCPDKFHDRDLELTNWLKDNTTDNGILLDPYDLMLTSFGLAEQMKFYKLFEPELYQTLQKATFINSRGQISSHSELIQEHAKQWLEDNAKYIWGIRVFYLMLTDHDFWVDNRYAEWVDLIERHFDVEIDKLEASDYRPYNHRYLLPEQITNLFAEKDHSRIEHILENYAMYRDILGYEPYYSSLWQYNFTEVDLDDAIFANFSPS